MTPWRGVLRRERRCVVFNLLFVCRECGWLTSTWPRIPANRICGYCASGLSARLGLVMAQEAAR